MSGGSWYADRGVLVGALVAMALFNAALFFVAWDFDKLVIALLALCLAMRWWIEGAT